MLACNRYVAQTYRHNGDANSFVDGHSDLGVVDPSSSYSSREMPIYDASPVKLEKRTRSDPVSTSGTSTLQGLYFGEMSDSGVKASLEFFYGIFAKKREKGSTPIAFNDTGKKRASAYYIVVPSICNYVQGGFLKQYDGMTPIADSYVLEKSIPETVYVPALTAAFGIRWKEKMEEMKCNFEDVSAFCITTHADLEPHVDYPKDKGWGHTIVAVQLAGPAVNIIFRPFPDSPPDDWHSFQTKVGSVYAMVGASDARVRYLHSVEASHQMKELQLLSPNKCHDDPSACQCRKVLILRFDRSFDDPAFKMP